MDKFEGGIIIIAVVLAGFFGWGAYYNKVIVSYHFDQQIGNYFQLSDAASTACVKLGYWQQFVQALLANGLNHGQSTIFFPQLISDLSYQYNANVPTVQARLVVLCQDEKTNNTNGDYQFGMQELSVVEYTCFPLRTFYQGYALNNGAWGDALMPFYPSSTCASATQS